MKNTRQRAMMNVLDILKQVIDVSCMHELFMLHIK